MLVFNTTQFFSSLNYQLIPLILKKAGFNLRISLFFLDYLVDRKTRYLWNGFTSLFFSMDVGIGQRLALSPILSALLLLQFFTSLKKE